MFINFKNRICGNNTVHFEYGTYILPVTMSVHRSMNYAKNT